LPLKPSKRAELSGRYGGVVAGAQNSAAAAAQGGAVANGEESEICFHGGADD